MNGFRNWILAFAAIMFAGTASATSSYDLTAAQADGYARNSAGHAFWIPDLSRDLVFDGPGLLVMNSNEWRVTGTIRDGDIAFDVDLSYTGIYTQNADPKLELKPSAYVDNGGPVDPTSWIFAHDVAGTLTGVAGSRYDGAVLLAEDRGPSAQFGYGASGKNVDLGLSNWFDFWVVDQGIGETLDFQHYTGDINVTAAPVPEPAAALTFALGALLLQGATRRNRG